MASDISCKVCSCTVSQSAFTGWRLHIHIYTYTYITYMRLGQKVTLIPLCQWGHRGGQHSHSPPSACPRWCPEHYTNILHEHSTNIFDSQHRFFVRVVKEDVAFPLVVVRVNHAKVLLGETSLWVVGVHPAQSDGLEEMWSGSPTWKWTSAFQAFHPPFRATLSHTRRSLSFCPNPWRSLSSKRRRLSSGKKDSRAPCLPQSPLSHPGESKQRVCR